MTTPPGFQPLEPYDPGLPAEDAAQRFHDTMRLRRSVRMYDRDRPVSRELIEQLVATAGTAPSGANKQPWHFVAIQDPALKHEIRLAAEEEERAFYHGRANESWLTDLAPIGTDEHKEFLEHAPWIIVIFKVMKDLRAGAASEQVYYVNESVGIATGLLIAAIHNAGLVTLTHTPSPMKFLTTILRRPATERPYLLLPVGWPSADAIVPAITRKPLGDILTIDRPDTPSDPAPTPTRTAHDRTRGAADERALDRDD